MSVEVKDILLKAAEDVQQGMWCAGSRFSSTRNDRYAGDFENVIGFTEAIDDLLGKYRCAEGSLIVATRLLGGSSSHFIDAVEAINAHSGQWLMTFNDIELAINRRADPFEAGQQLAELFRSTAESL